jgi:ribose 5-phosphate isomerase A
MASVDPSQAEAARFAASLIESGMTIGLGSGSTAELFVHRLAERIQKENLRIVGVSTSVSTAELASSLGITLAELDDVAELDLDIDGADEVDPQFQMIKGRGGKLLREKIVAAAARMRMIVVTEAKRVDRLGRHYPVPVEVSSFGISHTERALQELGAQTSIRTDSDGSIVVTDGGNRILDCRFEPIDDPLNLDIQLHRIPGVLETGIFVGLCDVLIVGRENDVVRIDNPRSRSARASST